MTDRDLLSSIFRLYGLLCLDPVVTVDYRRIPVTSPVSGFGAPSDRRLTLFSRFFRIATFKNKWELPPMRVCHPYRLYEV